MYYGGVQNPAYPANRQYYQAQQAAHLIGRQVKVNRGGPDSVEGVLIAIPNDYFVILSDDNIVYVNATHVKSITEGTADSDSRSGGGKSGGGKSGGGRSRGGSRSKSFITASSFNSLLSRLRHRHVQVNRGGPEKLEGFLAEVASDSVLLIVDRELVRIPTFHIKNVSVSNTNNQNNKNNNNKNGSGGNKNQSGGNRSGGNRSGGGRSSGNRSGGGRSSGNRSGGGRSRNRRSGSKRSGSKRS